MRKSIFFSSVLSLFLLVPASITWAQTISSQKGLTTAIFPTQYGNVKVYLPDDIRPGDVISGTVITEPKGNSLRQTERNLAELMKYSLRVDGNKCIVSSKPEMFKWLVNQDRQLSVPIELLNVSAVKVAELKYQLIRPVISTDPVPYDCAIPSHALTGEPMRIRGSFDGDASNTKCTLGNRSLDVLTESPRQICTLVSIDLEDPGGNRAVFSVQENGKQACSRNISLVNMLVTTGDLNLRKGQNTYIDVKLTGLHNLPGTAVLTITNITPNVVTITNGNIQVIPISPRPDSINETFSIHCSAVSITTGNFQVIIDLDLPETVDDHPPTKPQDGHNHPRDTTQKPPSDSTTVAQCPGCECSCSASILFDAKKGDESTYSVEVTPLCAGFFGIPPCEKCEVKGVSIYEWTVSSSADKPVTIVGARDGAVVKISNPFNGSFTLSIKVKVTCSVGSCTCEAVTRYLATNPPDIPGSCECHVDCKINKGDSTCGVQIFTADVNAECKGTGSKKDCKVESIEYLWFLRSDEHGQVEIVGPTNQASVKIKVNKPGKYVVFLKVTVSCTVGPKCSTICLSEEKADCLVDFKWCAGKPINIIKYGEYPNHPDVLQDMRPGETISLSVFARDEDNLLQYCGCEIQNHIHKHDPTPDLVIYDWKVEQLTGGAGRLIQQGGSLSNSVLYQLPFCIEDLPASVRITVSIKNAGKKADDEEVKVEYLIKMSLVETPKGLYKERKIAVSIESTILNEPKEVICEESTGPCVYSKHEWKKGKVATVSPKITKTLPEDNFPDNLVLLTVEAEDKDDLLLNCTYNGKITPKTISDIYDGFEIIWSIIKGEGYFLLGDMGPAVIFQHKYGEFNEVLIQCSISQGEAQHKDLKDPVILTIKIPARKKPVAFVGVGNIKHRSIKAIEHRELIVAAEKAVKKYEEAGYNVFTDFELAEASLERTYKNYACQAVLVIGHGDEFGLELFNEKDNFVHSNIRSWVREKWGCRAAQYVKHPSGRELIVMGCSLGKKEDEWYDKYFNLEKFYGRKEWVWSSWAFSSIVNYIEKELTPLPPRILAPK